MTASGGAAACDVCGAVVDEARISNTGTPGRVASQRTCPACAPEARRPVRMCVRCGVVTDRPVIVSEVHANSGPGFNVYACPPCASLLPAVPDVYELLEG